MRLDKFIGQSTAFSRRQIHALIKAGAVLVNGTLIKNPALHVSEQDQVTLDGQTLSLPALRYLMLHKPLGYVCANSDSVHPTVIDLIELPNKYSLQIVGRLDIDTTGLVLLTDDGQWNHRVTAPNSRCAKSYLCTTADPIPSDAVNIFAAGVQLHGEKNLTRPAQLELLGDKRARLRIHEGKYHQVKRMFAATGNHIVSLHRESIGGIKLDPGLAPGDYRPLTPTEIESLLP
jgi:16S rRNA pseudouridine516 synthase